MWAALRLEHDMLRIGLAESSRFLQNASLLAHLPPRSLPSGLLPRTAPSRAESRARFHYSVPQLAAPQAGSSNGGGKKAKPNPGIEVGARNDTIAFRRVRLVDPQTGELRPLAPLSDILAEIFSGEDKGKDFKRKHAVQLVSTEPEPIVRLVNTSEQYRKAKEQKHKARLVGRSEEKEIQLTWDTSGMDYQRKLDQAREALAEGHRVTLAHAPKKGIRHVLRANEMAERAQETVDALAEVGKEWKQREVGPRITVVFLEGLEKKAVVVEQEVLIPLGAPPTIVQRRVADIQKALALGERVKVHFAEEKVRKEEKSKGGSLVSDVLGILKAAAPLQSPSSPAQQKVKPQEKEKWNRKRKDEYVESVVATLGPVTEWRARDDWTVSTTLYLTKE